MVDEYALFVGPAVVGGGNPFFPDGVRVELELLDTRRFGNGVVYLSYGVVHDQEESASAGHPFCLCWVRAT